MIRLVVGVDARIAIDRRESGSRRVWQLTMFYGTVGAHLLREI